MTDGTPWGGGGWGPGHGTGGTGGGGFGPPPPPAPPYPPQPQAHQGAPWYPPHSGYPTPPPRRRGPLLAVAGLATAALVAGLLIWAPWGGDGSGDGKGPSAAAPRDPAAEAERMLREAAETMSNTQVVAYRGDFALDSGASTPFDLQTTPGGWGRGSLQDQGATVRLLTTDDHRLTRAGKAYWKDRGYAGDLLDRIDDRWMDSSADLPEIDDLTTPLDPSNVSDLLRDAAGRGRPEAIASSTVAGRPVKVLTTANGRFWISDSVPRTLLRLAADDSPAASGPLPLPDGLDTTVGALTGADRETFTTAYERDLSALKSAVDPAVDFSTTGKARFSPCGNSSCTARFTLQNSVYEGLGDEEASGEPVYAEISIAITLDGRKVKTCTFQRKMKPSGTVSLTCTATYSAATTRNHTVRGLPDAWARAVPDPELARLRADFAKGVTDSQAA
ncbi:hypothetical protein [Actinacidiphila glaucinigra]|uniref:hypothetical protein n=1 Tax=Actinacidiphila glaucinigra TaxID=235986 RepID=UPI003D94082E